MAAGPWTLPAAAMARLETLQADRDREKTDRDRAA